MEYVAINRTYWLRRGKNEETVAFTDNYLILYAYANMSKVLRFFVFFCLLPFGNFTDAFKI